MKTYAYAFALIASGVMVLSGCKNEVQAASQPSQSKPVHVDTTEVVEAPMTKTLALTGTLRGQHESELAANAQGRVVATYVERGARVKAGQIVARLDTRAASITASEAKANAELAKAQRVIAERECERSAKLREKGALSQQEADRTSDQCVTSKLSVMAAEARAQSAAQVVGDGVIRSPIDGLVAERFVDVGEYVRAETKVATIVESDTLRLEFTVPEANLAQLRDKAPVSFQVPAFPERRFTGTVQYIGASVRESTRDVVVEALVDNPDGALRSGMFATVELSLGETPMPVIPSASVHQRDGMPHVYVVASKRLEERVIQLGSTKDDKVGVLRGLKAHEHVVTSSGANLYNGLAVE